MKKDMNRKILERFEMNLSSFINRYNKQQTVFLLAVSGGMDSMVLLDLFETLKEKADIKFAVANLDHCIRKASEHEQSWLKTYCGKKEIPFFGKKVDVPFLKDKAGAQQSVEQIAREQRYIFLNEAKERVDADWILTAHHKDDLLETFLIRLLRGTGINGLNILNKVASPFMRPLIDFWKEEITAYCHERELHYFEDESNRDNQYMRNRIRNRLIPFLSSEFDVSVKEVLIRDLYNFKNSASVIDDYLAPRMEQCVFSEKRVAIKEMFMNGETDAYAGELLVRVYQRWNGSPVGLSGKKIGDILDRMKKNGDFEITISHGIKFSRSGNTCLFEKREKTISSGENTIIEFDLNFKKNLLEKNVINFNLDQFDLNKTVRFELIETVDFDEADKTTVFVDFCKLKFPLKLRYWKEGDKFKPLGMKNSKRISRFFTDQGIKRIQKRKQLILDDVKHDIICCIGLRCSEDYKVSGNTEKILKIEYK
jgi:tRNA(Ile)-lysidine synthase